MIFIYRCDCGNYWAALQGQFLKCSMCGSKERTNIATIDPAAAISRALNGDEKFIDIVRDIDMCDENGGMRWQMKRELGI